MKINTRISAQEMAIQTPTQSDLEMIKLCIPDASRFPLPTPETVAQNYMHYINSGYCCSPELQQFLTGKKLRGNGVALASYPTLYERCIVHLECLWTYKDQPAKVTEYLLNNPIYYKPKQSPDLAIDQETGAVNEPMFVANCISNLMEYIYLSSCPAYQYLRENLLEKARYIRDNYRKSSENRGAVRVLPQRTTTSRNLGDKELRLHRVNAGYRITTTTDPYTNESFSVLELITWFFTNSKTEKRIFKDYFDIDNGDTETALRQMYASELYRKWAEAMSPKDYAATCANFSVPDADVEKELIGLTIITGNTN